MILTEEEAKTKWCKDTRLLEGDPPGAAAINRGPSSDNGCLASGCMQWRWFGHFNPDGTFMKRMGERSWQSADVATGYCGLSPRPE